MKWRWHPISWDILNQVIDMMMWKLLCEGRNIIHCALFRQDNKLSYYPTSSCRFGLKTGEQSSGSKRPAMSSLSTEEKTSRTQGCNFIWLVHQVYRSRQLSRHKETPLQTLGKIKTRCLPYHQSQRCYLRLHLLGSSFRTQRKCFFTPTPPQKKHIYIYIYIYI